MSVHILVYRLPWWGGGGLEGGGEGEFLHWGAGGGEGVSRELIRLNAAM